MIRSTVLLLSVLCAMLVAGCASEDSDPLARIMHPQWTPSASHVVALYEDEGNGGRIRGLLTRRLDTWQEARYPLPLSSADQPFWITRKDEAMVLASDSIVFTTLTGTMAGRVTLSRTFRGQGYLSFLPNADAWFYCGSDGTRLIVGRCEYAGSPWTLTQQQVYLDSVTTARPIAMTFTGLFSCLVRLDDGTLLEVGEGGTVHRLDVAHTSFGSPWQARLHLYRINTSLTLDQGRTNLRVYFRDGIGVRILTLSDYSLKTIIEGSVADFDVTDLVREVIYDTGTRDLWLGTADGSPLLRFAPPKHTMGAFSPDGRKIAAVAHVNDTRDSLRIIRTQ